MGKKILLLSDINSAHTQKWILGLLDNGFEIAVFSFRAPVTSYEFLSRIQFCTASVNKTFWGRLKHFNSLRIVKKAIKNFKPDIVHAHYASSYGLVGALTGFRPFVISAWGSDVMRFPNKNFITKLILKYNFKKAQYITVSSKILHQLVEKLTGRSSLVIPFGINTSEFCKRPVPSLFSENCTVVGTVKSLEKIYGIDILIKTFARLLDESACNGVRLLIVGGGSCSQEYAELAKELRISDKIIFTGKVEASKVVEYHNKIDVFVNLSYNESFGVSVLEASACERPVIATNVGGLKEVVVYGQTGFLIEPGNVDAAMECIKKLVLDAELRKKMGEQGRQFVVENYDWNLNVKQMCELYTKI